MRSYWRALGSFVVMLASGVLASAFVAEIYQDGKLDWSAFYTAYAFWGLVALVLGNGVYQWRLQRRLARVEAQAAEIEKYRDPDYMHAVARRNLQKELEAEIKRAMSGEERFLTPEDSRRILGLDAPESKGSDEEADDNG